MEKNLNITKRPYSEHILLVPWPFVLWRFHCIGFFSIHFTFTKAGNIVRYTEDFVLYIDVR